MNQVSKEIESYFGISNMNPVAQEILMHYGVGWDDNPPGIGSGRYPHGSGKNPNQHSGDFMTRVNNLRKENPTYIDPKTGKTYTGEAAIARILGMDSTTQLRVQYSMAKDAARADRYNQAMKLLEEGYSRNEVVEKLGLKNESSLRSLMNQGSKSRMEAAKDTADVLKKFVDENGMLDVGDGTERYLGISKEKLRESLEILKDQGYEVYGGRIEQVTNKGKHTTLQVLCPPGTEHKEIFDYDNIHYITEAEGQGKSEITVQPVFKYPESLDSSRLMIKYNEEGGVDKDGVIELRRGVPDISLGGDNYAQVRMLVDGTHYIKGMAVYADDLPPGIDVRFNTNKHLGTPALGDDKNNTVLKKIKTEDPTNPFGSLLKEKGGQSYYIDEDGKEHLSLINKTRAEGDWDEWSNKVPSQLLAKQPVKLAERQLNLSIADKKAEYDEICNLTNPTVKKRLLESFAEDCDSAAVHLKAAAFPGQRYQVMLPLTSIKDTEVYAPNYNTGQKLACIRFPYGHTSEGVILTVNNRNEEGKRVITPGAKDAIGISKNVADRMSGADFDGDTAMVIPLSSKVNIRTSKQLDGLKDFDPKEQYGPNSEGSKGRTYKQMKNTQNEMGRISNLLSDMNIKGARDDEIARALKHSMVVIDAEKHNLDYQRSYKENRIDELKRIYQKGVNDKGEVKYGGASTLISRAKNEQTVDKRQGTPRINPDGSLSYKTADNLYYTDKNGKVKKRTQASTQMAETKDAYTLSTGTAIENTYASYANNLKSLANSARKEMINTGSIKYSADAKKKYQPEVDQLMAQLNTAKKNAPKERQAQIIATSKVKAMKQENPDMKKDEIKKAKQRALTEARNVVGAKRTTIEITPKQWDAIQSGAITETKLKDILTHTDTDKIKAYATPRKTTNELSSAKQNQIKAMKASGYTNAEIAERLNISKSTVSKYR